MTHHRYRRTTSRPVPTGHSGTRRGPRLRQGVSVALLTALLAGLAPAAQADPPRTTLAGTTLTGTTSAATTTAAVDDLLTSLQTRSSGTDYRYLENRVWVDGTPTCFRCTLGPSVLSAGRGRDLGSDSALLAVAVATMDTAIANHQRADGSFGPMGPGEGGYDIQTVMFANELAWTYLVLDSDLDSAHRTQWATALTRAADWLVRNGNLTWYVNGNINLAVAMNMDLTYRITGLPRFRTAAATALAFTLSPAQDRWAGFGLRYTKVPTRADGSDGSAFLAEKGGGQVGFDPVYSLLQLDLASMWYSVTGSDTPKRLTNLLLNQLWPRVRTSDWTVDVSGGTRRLELGARYCFCTSAVSVLGLDGSRPDLAPLVPAQVGATLTDYANAIRYPSPGLSYNIGLELTPVYRAVTGAR